MIIHLQTLRCQQVMRRLDNKKAINIAIIYILNKKDSSPCSGSAVPVRLFAFRYLLYFPDQTVHGFLHLFHRLCGLVLCVRNTVIVELDLRLRA